MEGHVVTTVVKKDNKLVFKIGKNKPVEEKTIAGEEQKTLKKKNLQIEKKKKESKKPIDTVVIPDAAEVNQVDQNSNDEVVTLATVNKTIDDLKRRVIYYGELIEKMYRGRTD